MTLSRRDFIKSQAAAAAAAVAGISAPGCSAPKAERRQGPLGQGAVPLLRHRLRRAGGHAERPRGRDPGRPRGRGQPRAQLRQGLFPLEDHVRRRPAEDAAAAQEERPLRQGGRIHAGVVEGSVRHHGGEVEGRAEERRPDHGRHVRLRPVDGVGRLRGGEALQGGLPLEQPRSQRAPLHGLRGDRLHAHLRHGRADGLLRRLRERRRLRHVGLEHGGDAPGAVDAHHRPPAVASRT